MMGKIQNDVLSEVTRRQPKLVRLMNALDAEYGFIQRIVEDGRSQNKAEQIVYDILETVCERGSVGVQPKRVKKARPSRRGLVYAKSLMKRHERWSVVVSCNFRRDFLHKEIGLPYPRFWQKYYAAVWNIENPNAHTHACTFTRSLRRFRPIVQKELKEAKHFQSPEHNQFMARLKEACARLEDTDVTKLVTRLRLSAERRRLELLREYMEEELTLTRSSPELFTPDEVALLEQAREKLTRLGLSPDSEIPPDSEQDA